MAENRLETQILLRYDTYDRWIASDVILGPGEAAIAAFPNENPTAPPRAIGIKIGDGRHYFDELPWTQAIAADVYNWAKSSTPPSADTIPGLDNYITTHSSSNNSKLYQLIRGTGNDANKYYLQSRDNVDGSQWTTDTSHYIDVGDLAKIKDWIGSENLGYPTLDSVIVEQVLLTFNLIGYTDQAEENKFVTAVNQTNGQISVQRERPTFSNIDGYATVTQGGTGRTSFTQGQVLVGNGENAISTISIATDIENNNDLVPNYLIKQYVDSATMNVSKAMHFIGETTVPITHNSRTNPEIAGYIFSRAQPGDLILYDEQEFVWDGSEWRLLGHSYAVSGEIQNSDISSNAAIAQSKIANLTNDLNSKVDKVDGMGLSDNNYSDTEKSKLQLIENGAQQNIIEHIFVNGDEQIPTTIDGNSKSISLPKLDGIETGAQVNIIEHITMDGVEVTPNNKTVNLESKIDSISVNGISFQPDANKTVNLTINPSVLNLTVLENARYPSGNGGYTSIEKDATGKILELSKVAATGDVNDLVQATNTYVILNCGTSTLVV